MNILAFRRDGATLAACNISNGCFPSSWTPKGTPDPPRSFSLPSHSGKEGCAVQCQRIGLGVQPRGCGGRGSSSGRAGVMCVMGLGAWGKLGMMHQPGKDHGLGEA